MAATFGITARAFRWYNDDGSESASTAIDVENANITRQGTAPNVVLRYGVQESGSGSANGAATDDYQLQVSKNAGAYADVTGATANIKARVSANLTDAGATTNRLSAGSGAFIAGEIDEVDGLITDWQLTANNFSELLYSLELVPADLVNGDTLDFRVLRNGAVFNTYSVTPRITFSVPPTADNAYETAIFADSPVFVASMEEASGNLTDIIAGKVGTVSGTPTYGVTGPISGKTAIDFPGAATEFFTFADHADLDLGDGPFSIEFWLARDVDTGAFELVMDKGSGAYAIAVAASSWPDKMSIAKQGTAVLFVSANTIAADSAWHHWVITRSGTGATNTIIYRDGVSDTAAAVDSATALVNNTSSLLLGKEAAGAPLNGKLAYIALYKSVLSSTRVTAHYDAAASGTTYTRTATDSLTSSDTLTRIFTGARTTTDALTSSDTATRVATLLRSVTDNRTFSDTASRIVAAVRSATDNRTTSDTAARVGTFARSVADSLTHSDAATRLGTFLRAVSDALTSSDAASGIKLIIRTAVDSLTHSDAATRLLTLARSATDSRTTSDAATRVLTAARTASDALIHSDAATRLGTFLRAVTDVRTYSDVAEAIKTGTIVRTAADALTHSDSAARVVSLARAASDALTSSDTATRAKAAVRSATDSLTSSDAATRSKTAVRSAIDNLIFSDLAAAIGGGVTIIGGLPPVAYARGLVMRALGINQTPGGRATNPGPTGNASTPTPE